MSGQDKTQFQDLALWREYRAAGGTEDAAAAPDCMSLAAYLDGTLDEAERAQVEAWLAAAPERLGLLIASREALSEPSLRAPEAVVRRAMDLVPDESSASLNGLLSQIVGLLSPARLLRPLGWSCVAVALVLACAAGFELGRAGYATTLAADQHLAYDSDLVLGEIAEEFL